MSRFTTGADYDHYARALDEHVESCPFCQHGGRGCPDGDDTAEAEFRAYRDWSHSDPDNARAARTRGPGQGRRT